MAGLDERPFDVHQILDVLTTVTIKHEIHIINKRRSESAYIRQVHDNVMMYMGYD